MNEYWIENGPVDPDPLQADLLPLDTYREAHAGMVIACHDIFIEYMGGMLLVRRTNFPAVDILWPIGGRVARGMGAEDSIRLKVRQECNLDLSDVEVIGHARTYFSTDPFGHGKGTDSLNIVLRAKGFGELKLDDLHERPSIIKPEEYTDDFRAQLHPYVRDYMDVCWR